jgi:hypothetical protein
LSSRFQKNSRAQTAQVSRNSGHFVAAIAGSAGFPGGAGIRVVVFRGAISPDTCERGRDSIQSL